MLLQLVEKKDSDAYLSLTGMLNSHTAYTPSNNFQTMISKHIGDLSRQLRTDAINVLKNQYTKQAHAQGASAGQPHLDTDYNNPSRISGGRARLLPTYGFSTDPVTTSDKQQNMAQAKPELRKILEFNSKIDQALQKRRNGGPIEEGSLNISDKLPLLIQSSQLKNPESMSNSRVKIICSASDPQLEIQLIHFKFFDGMLFKLSLPLSENSLVLNILREQNVLEIRCSEQFQAFMGNLEGHRPLLGQGLRTQDTQSENIIFKDLLQEVHGPEEGVYTSTVPLIIDNMHRGLAERTDCLARLFLILGARLQIDGKAYQPNPNEIPVNEIFKKPIMLTSHKPQERPTDRSAPPRPTGQPTGQNLPPAEAQNSSEQRVFESNFQKADLAEFKNFENTVMSKCFV